MDFIDIGFETLLLVESIEAVVVHAGAGTVDPMPVLANGGVDEDFIGLLIGTRGGYWYASSLTLRQLTNRIRKAGGDVT